MKRDLVDVFVYSEMHKEFAAWLFADFVSHFANPDCRTDGYAERSLWISQWAARIKGAENSLEEMIARYEAATNV